MAKCNDNCCHCSQVKGECEALPENTSQPRPVAQGKPDVIRLYGLDCPDCADKLENRLQTVAGVEKAQVNYASGKLTIWHNGDLRAIMKTIQRAGYQGVADDHGADQKISEWKSQPLKKVLTLISGLLLVAGLLSMFFNLGGNISILFFLAAIVTGGYYVAGNAFYALKSFDFDMNVLLTVAVIGAGAIGQWAEGATAVFLFSLGNTLQALSMDKTRNSIKSLMEFAPPAALIRRDGREMEIPVESIAVGDLMIVKPGSRIAMDGLVRKGVSMVNQSPITGESLPVEKMPGADVFAGTFNEQGALEVEVTKLVQDNTLSRIIVMVGEAQGRQAPAQMFVDRFARYYTPAVILLAIGMATLPPLLGGQSFVAWFEKALIMLVIACPCALVISTPVAIVSAIGVAAKKGVLIKGGAYLEKAGSVRAIAFDKTGTLTYGTPAVTDVIPLSPCSTEELLSMAMALEKNSQHVLAQAIVQKAAEMGVRQREPDDFQSYLGRGAGALIEGQMYYIGSPEIFKDLHLDLTDLAVTIDALQAEGKTVILLGTSLAVLGIIALADQPRAESAAVLQSLKAAGITQTVLLTGDNPGTAGAMAAKLGISDYRAGLLPDAKLTAIQALQAQYGPVAMVGDGVNDAPALAMADVGIAMGNIGTDVALEAADMVLVGDELAQLPYAIHLSRRTLQVIKQNIIFAIAVKALFMAGTFIGITNLWLAVLADTGASLLVIANSMRLLLVRGEG